MKILRLNIFFVITIIISLIIGFYGCKKNANQDTKKIRIVTTLFPLYEFSKEIAGANATVELLLPPGAEPHSFEPKPKDIAKLNNADLLVYTGQFMEPWVEKILKTVENKSLIIVDASQGVRLLKTKDSHHHNHKHQSHNADVDPHIWLDLRNAIKMVDNIQEGIVKKDYINHEYYKNNADRYKTLLSNIDLEYENTISLCPKKTIISGGHHSFGYLANRYNLNYYSAYGISPDSEPSPKTLARLSLIIKREGIKHVVFEELISPRVAETIARETGAEVVLVRAGHNIEIDEFKRGKTFISILNDNFETLKKVLQCQKR